MARAGRGGAGVKGKAQQAKFGDSRGSTAIRPPDPARFDLSDPDDARSAILAAMSEAEFQKLVVDGLRSRYYAVWTVPDMRRTTAGLPDIIALGPMFGPGSDRPRLLFYELKREKGRVRPEQQAVIECLQLVTVVDARILRPSGWDAVRDALDTAAPSLSSARGEG